MIKKKIAEPSGKAICYADAAKCSPHFRNKMKEAAYVIGTNDAL